MGTWVDIGWVVLAVLLLIPIVLIGRLAFGLFSAWRDSRLDDAARRTVAVPGLDSFESTDGVRWFGRVDGINVEISTGGEPPGASVTAPIRELLARLPRLGEEASAFLNATWFAESGRGGDVRVEPVGLEFESIGRFSVVMTESDDEDWSHTVVFHEGVPVESEHDH